MQVKAVIRDWGPRKDALVLQIDKPSQQLWENLSIKFICNGKDVTEDNPDKIRETKNRAFCFTPCTSPITAKVTTKTKISLRLGSSRLEWSREEALEFRILPKTGDNEETETPIIQKRKLIDASSDEERVTKKGTIIESAQPFIQSIQKIMDQYRMDVVMYSDIARLREKYQAEMFQHVLQQINEMCERQDHTVRIECHKPALASKVAEMLNGGNHVTVENDQIVVTIV